MKTIFKRTSTHLLIATLAAGMGVHLSSHAQSAPADTSSVVITGQITANIRAKHQQQLHGAIRQNPNHDQPWRDQCHHCHHHQFSLRL